MEDIKIKTFSKAGVVLPLPYLLSTLKESWDRFLKEDLKELFAEISPIRDYTGKELELWFADYKLDEPKYADDVEAKENNDFFAASLRIKIKLNDLRTKKTKEQEIFLTDFPLMTDRGTFIINGIERVVIAQLIRSPGVFFTIKNAVNKNYFGAKIIPDRGSWLEFETETSGFISVKIDRKRKIPVTVLLRAFGIQGDRAIKELFQDVDKGEVCYIEETLKRDVSSDQNSAVVEIYKRLRPGDLASPETAKELINSMFSFERYDLSKVGRWKMWQRLPALLKLTNTKDDFKSKKVLDSPEIIIENRVLKLEDIIETIKEIIRLNNDPQAKPDEIDHLGNRRIRTGPELLKNKLRAELMRMRRMIKDRMSVVDSAYVMPSQLVNPRPFMAAVKGFFNSSQASQFMDNQNPLAELEHKRRLSATGPGGLTRERAGFEVRDVQSSHYGRICPIQTPEGPNVGIVNHLALFARINSYGFIECPYFQIKNGKVSPVIQYLNAYQEENYNIAHGGVSVDSQRMIMGKRVEVRHKGEPNIVDKSKVDFIDVSPEQCISVATSLIPFLQNDDANRAQMGSNMQRQAVPLLKPEIPLVSTGTERNAAIDSGQVIVAQEDGQVVGVDAEHIKVKICKSEKENVKENQDFSKASSVVVDGMKIKEYKLRIFAKTNQYTCFHQQPIVKKGDKIKKGDPLTEGGGTNKGYLSLGKNIFVAFMSWRGGNFEDAILISERLVKDDIYTSIHIEDFICDVRETKLGPEITTCDIPNVGEDKLQDLDEQGIIRVGAEVGPNDILVGKISPKGESDLTAEERLLKAIFGEKARDVKDTSLVMEHGKRGRVIGVRIFSREQGHKLEPGVISKIKVEVAQLRKVKAGDKLVGRHGNKGVISKILPIEEMPFMEDGTPVDIILNPLGVVSRMNIGQILEMHLGWAAKKLGYIAVTPSLSGAQESDIKKELKRAGLPEDGKVTLYDGRTGEPFIDKIGVGYIYMFKLTHMVEDKIHMRSIGPYSLITQQPLGGKAQFGGQRLGEMEVWALEGYGAVHTLQELLTIKSDDVQGRASAYESILKGEPIKNPNIPASFQLLISELKALGLDIKIKLNKK